MIAVDANSHRIQKVNRMSRAPTKSSPKSQKKTGQSQVDLFRSKAREIGADVDAGDDDAMRRLSRQKRNRKPDVDD